MPFFTNSYSPIKNYQLHVVHYFKNKSYEQNIIFASFKLPFLFYMLQQVAKVAVCTLGVNQRLL
ncbi:MAG: hypothetical protein DRQ51_10050 [Gammaproteobacteria bacterium]|nr:MAG: hypothetical protein DRQ51_10050 [Gammaproteobacteria bacterium]